MKELDMKETAVLSAMMVDRVRNFGFSPYEFALNLLDGHPDGLSEEEFKKIEKQLKKVSFKLDAESVRGKVPSKYLSNKEIINLLGEKSLVMFHNPLKKQTGEVYKIIFNVDGKGGIRHPDGSIKDGETLKDATESLVKIRDLTNISAGEITRNAWKVDSEVHPEVKGLQHHIKAYVERFLM